MDRSTDLMTRQDELHITAPHHQNSLLFLFCIHRGLSNVFFFYLVQIFTLPSGAVIAKYYDEYVCVCLRVCLSARISPELYARSLPNFLCLLLMAVAPSTPGRVTKSQGKRSSFGGFLPHWQCIIQHSIWNPYKNG